MSEGSRYVLVPEAISGSCRKDKKINVYFLPLYRHFYVRKQEWNDWFIFSTSMKGVMPKTYGRGAWYTQLTIHSVNESGRHQFLIFNPMRSDTEYDCIFPRFSLRPGYYTATVKAYVYENINSEKNPVDEEFTEELSFYVPENGDVVLFLFAAVGAKYQTYEQWDSIFDKWQLKTKLMKNHLAHEFLQLTPQEATSIYPYWKDCMYGVDVEPVDEPWGFEPPAPAPISKAKPSASTRSSSVKSKPAPKSDLYDKKQKIRTVSNRSELCIADDYGTNGLFGGAQISAEKDSRGLEYVTLEETQFSSSKKAMYAKVRALDGDAQFCQTVNGSRVGGRVETNNAGGIFYSYKDSYGRYQRYCISINPTNIVVYEAKDGWLTGKAYVINDDVHEAQTNRYKVLDKRALISTPFYAYFKPLEIKIPYALTTQSVELKETFGGYTVAQQQNLRPSGYGICKKSDFVAGFLDGDGLDGVGICRTASGEVRMGGFQNGLRHGLVYSCSADGSVEYIHNYKNGKIDGPFFELHEDRVIIGKYAYEGKIADKSIVICTDDFGFFISNTREGALNNVPRKFHGGGGVRVNENA